jgi:hypothetical protein
MVKWLSTIKQAGEGSMTIEKMALDERAIRSPPANSRRWKPILAGAGAGPGRRPVGLLTACPAWN